MTLGREIEMSRQQNVLLTTDEYVVTYRFRSYYERASATRVYVSSTLTETHDAKYRELREQEAALGDQRWSERGKRPEVDKLYDRMNRRYARVQRDLALAAVHKIDEGYEHVTGRFSRYAGCSCKCSPGVVLSREIYVDGRQVDLWVSPPKSENAA